MTLYSLRRRDGLTLVELIITVTVMAVMLLTVVPLFNVTNRGYTSLEVNTVISAGAQTAVAKMQNRLAENKRLFSNDATGIAFLARVSPSVSPSVLTGSKLPVIVSTASLSPSSGTFSAGNVGNCLFFASIDQSVDLSSVLNGSGVNTSVRLDAFTFNYYYLAPDTGHTMGANYVIDLWEWHSKPYIDYLGLANLVDLTQRNNAIAKLVTQGYTYAFNSSATAVNAGFYQLSGSSPWLTAVPAHNIVKNDSEKMFDLIKGVTTGSFVYAVSPNTTPTFNHKYVVPNYGTASGQFPSGFETMIVGSSGNRRVFARLVMAARGSFKGNLAYEQVLLVAARDLW